MFGRLVFLDIYFFGRVYCCLFFLGGGGVELFVGFKFSLFEVNYLFMFLIYNNFKIYNYYRNIVFYI